MKGAAILPALSNQVLTSLQSLTSTYRSSIASRKCCMRLTNSICVPGNMHGAVGWSMARIAHLDGEQAGISDVQSV
eukprot:809217-Rhodomonas_salina.4